MTAEVSAESAPYFIPNHTGEEKNTKQTEVRIHDAQYKKQTENWTTKIQD
jgi:hypothetical protein